MVSWTLVAHIFGLVLWLSGLLTTTITLSRHVRETAPEASAALARMERIFMRALADPGAALTILAGILLISSNPNYFLHARWLHIKLTFVITLILLHGIVAVLSKRFATGRMNLTATQVRLLLVALVVVFLLILIATLPGAVFLT